MNQGEIMQFRKLWGQGVCLLAMLAGSGHALAAAQSPTAMRGVWFEDSGMGQHQCLQYRLRRTGELVPGTLVVSDTQIAEARKGVQEDMLFLTRVSKLSDDAWQVVGLLDVYPYEKIKEIRTYGFSLRDAMLYRSSSVAQEGKEVMHTQVYRRCL